MADIKAGSLLRLRKDDGGGHRLELVTGPRKIHTSDPQTMLAFVTPARQKFSSME